MMSSAIQFISGCWFCSVESAVGRAVFALDGFCSSCAGLSEWEAVLRAGPASRTRDLVVRLCCVVLSGPHELLLEMLFWSTAFLFSFIPPLSFDPPVFRETLIEQLFAQRPRVVLSAGLLSFPD